MTTTDYRQDDLTQPPPALSYDIVSWLLTGVSLFIVLPLHLLPALVAGLVVYELVHVLARALRIFRIHHKRGQLVAVGIVAFGVVLLLTIVGAGIVAFVQADNLSTLFNTMTDSIERWRSVLPDSIAEQLPVDVEELRQAVVAWLGLHAGELKQVGTEAGRTLAHIFFGLGIGVMNSARRRRSIRFPVGWPDSSSSQC